MSDDFPLDFKTLRPSRAPNQVLVLPPGFEAAATPDATSQLAPGAPRPELGRGDGGNGQAAFVARSRIFRFPDRITVAVFAMPGEGERSALAIWSRAVYGRRDFGVNRRRIERWLAKLTETLGRA